MTNASIDQRFRSIEDQIKHLTEALTKWTPPPVMRTLPFINHKHLRIVDIADASKQEGVIVKDYDDIVYGDKPEKWLVVFMKGELVRVRVNA